MDSHRSFLASDNEAAVALRFMCVDNKEVGATGWSSRVVNWSTVDNSSCTVRPLCLESS